MPFRRGKEKAAQKRIERRERRDRDAIERAETSNRVLRARLSRRPVSEFIRIVRPIEIRLKAHAKLTATPPVAAEGFLLLETFLDFVMNFNRPRFTAY